MDVRPGDTLLMKKPHPCGTNAWDATFGRAQRGSPSLTTPGMLPGSGMCSIPGINSYFLDHPEMVMGRNSSESTAHGMDYTVEPLEDISLADQLHEAVRHIHGTYQEVELPDLGEGEEIRDTIPADPDVKNFSYALVDGEVYFRENSVMVRPQLNNTARERVKGMIGLKDCVRQLIDLQMDEYSPDSAIQQKQAELNTLYDSFTEKYGILNSRGNRLALAKAIVEAHNGTIEVDSELGIGTTFTMNFLIPTKL